MFSIQQLLSNLYISIRSTSWSRVFPNIHQMAMQHGTVSAHIHQGAASTWVGGCYVGWLQGASPLLAVVYHDTVSPRPVRNLCHPETSNINLFGTIKMYSAYYVTILLVNIFYEFVHIEIL